MTRADLANAPDTMAASTVLYHPDPVVLDKLLSALDQDGMRLFVFANGPVEDIVEKRLAALSNARIIRVPQNVGLAAGMNALAQAAIAEAFSHLLIFDQDSAPEPSLPSMLFAGFQAAVLDNRRPGVLGPLLVAPADEAYLSIRYSWRDETSGTVDFVPTSGSLISLAAWQDIGPFRDDYFIGGIDVEWGFRAWHKGYACIVDRDIKMVHRWGTITAGNEKWSPQILRQAPARTYFYLRNSVDCLRLKHIPLSWKIRFAPALVAQIGVLLAARRFSKSTLRVVGRGLWDGWNGRMGPLPVDFPKE